MAERSTDETAEGQATDDLSYEETRDILSSGNVARMTALARRTDVRPEILYYLAQQGPSGARLAVAKNPRSPIQADQLLADDDIDEVRAELARKISRIVPDATAGENARLREAAIEILETLAKDQLPTIREILADEVKSLPGVPHGLARQLAGDDSETVSCPMLEYSPLLGEEDLRELIAAGLTQKALAATARREGLPETVADDIASTLDVPAVADLLTNESAQIREDTMDKIITQAEQVNALHQPLAMRPDLSQRAMTRIAGFVASSLVETMAERNQLSTTAKAQLLKRVKQRVAAGRVGKGQDSETLAMAQKMVENDRVDDESVADLLDQGKRELVTVCLALKSRIPLANVQRLLEARAPRAVTALAWRCGLRMKTAYLLQAKLAMVPPGELLPARDGQYYPLSKAELEKQLSFFL